MPIWILLGLVTSCFVVIPLFLTVQEAWSHHHWSSQFPDAYTAMEARAKWVSGFKTSNATFPTREEIASRFPPHGFYLQTGPASWNTTWGKPGEAFIVHETVGEWNLSLQSWDGGRSEVYNE